MIMGLQVLGSAVQIFRIFEYQPSLFHHHGSLGWIGKADHRNQGIRITCFQLLHGIGQLLRRHKRGRRIDTAGNVKMHPPLLILCQHLCQHVIGGSKVSGGRFTPEKRNLRTVFFRNLCDLLIIRGHHDMVKQSAGQCRFDRICQDRFPAKFPDIFFRDPLAASPGCDNG